LYLNGKVAVPPEIVIVFIARTVMDLQRSKLRGILKQRLSAWEEYLLSLQIVTSICTAFTVRQGKKFSNHISVTIQQSSVHTIS
jgi:hypothetical protein